MRPRHRRDSSRTLRGVVAAALGVTALLGLAAGVVANGGVTALGTSPRAEAGTPALAAVTVAESTPTPTPTPTSAPAQPGAERGAEQSGASDPRYPVQWPFEGPAWISDGFGPRVPPCVRCSSFHRGTDFLPGDGAPVYAIADGVVRSVEGSGGLGVHVVIGHTIDREPVTSTYAHLQVGSVPLAEGQVVKVGDFVGRVGSTGWSTGAHLHFELRLGGTEAVDAFAWLTRYAGPPRAGGGMIMGHAPGGIAHPAPHGTPWAPGGTATDWDYQTPEPGAAHHVGELTGLSASGASSAEERPTAASCGGTTLRLIGRFVDVTAVLVGATQVGVTRIDDGPSYLFTAPPAPPGPVTVAVASSEGLLPGTATLTYVEDPSCIASPPGAGSPAPGTGAPAQPPSFTEPVGTPEPSPTPEPGVTPTPTPIPEPSAGPGPAPATEPSATPEPDAITTPGPAPEPTSTPAPVSSPTPEASPAPGSSPAPEPVPQPSAQSQPAPVPSPTPQPSTSPQPSPAPKPSTTAAPD
ncbi:M23 family metallopeptidase [Naasia sp. SYSU D00057]|uniref:M23 family metallopeptidase n=1 Tax=Naasia sp. SYSU D00057 TaxID=2817380 RepID=UPI001B305313|nr:M23 family metallopeptidase [Naasia sp. SYSU D00057]